MGMWFSIEVLDGVSSAALWQEVHGDTLVEAAFTAGATDWSWHRHSWGTVLELEVQDEEAWERFRAALAVQTALDAVPDPVSGLIVYRGRGGSAGRSQPRKPRPLIGSGAAALPLPTEGFAFELFPDDEAYRLFGRVEPRLVGTR